jgi:hypothetical protein
MRVRLHYTFVADISFVDEQWFDKIPTLTYKGMLIVDPQFQRIDMWYAIMKPLQNPPTENINNRLIKYNKYLAKYEEYYPIKSKLNKLDVMEITVPLSDIGNSVLDGFVAYAYLSSIVPLKYPLSFKVTSDTITFTSPACYNIIDIIDNDHLDVMNRFNGAKIEHYDELLTIKPEFMMIKTADHEIRVSNYNRDFINLILPPSSPTISPTTSSTISTTISSISSTQKSKFKCIGVPMLIEFILALMFTDSDNAEVYKLCYESLIGILSNPISMLSTELYKGASNVYYASWIQMQKELFEMKKISDNLALELPRGYYFEGGKANKPRPIFDHTKSRFFRTSGELTTGVNAILNSEVIPEL